MSSRNSKQASKQASKDGLLKRQFVKLLHRLTSKKIPFGLKLNVLSRGPGFIFAFTAAEITNACETWANFNGFEGYECSCGLKLNVLSRGPGFICVCGRYCVQNFSGGQVAFKRPDYGPTMATIREGIQNSPRWQKMIN